MNGVINIYKEKGWTSHDVIAKLRGILGTKKIGHAGTLDPEAEGVLPIGVGRGTRILEYIGSGHKVYEAEVVFGLRSNTEDLHGEVVEEPFDRERLSVVNIQAALDRLDGQVIAQVPPMFSSVKVGGKKLYQYARQGLEVHRESRNVELFQLQLLSDLYELGGQPRIRIRANVSKGTYIRTLCVDLGKILKVPAVMGELKRIEVGSFKEKDSLRLDAIDRMKKVDDLSFLHSLKSGIDGEMFQVELSPEDHARIRLGQKIENRYPVEDGSLFAGLYRGELVCILRNEDGLLRIIKNVGNQ